MMGDMYKGMKMIITETHSDIEVNPTFSETYFNFSLPEGAKFVEKFGSPSNPAGSEKSKTIGNQAPAFALMDLEGKKVNLDDFKGKVIIIDFWATWCGPCLKAMPHMQTLHSLYKDQDVVILGINSWERQPDKVKTVLEENKIEYTILLDSDNKVVDEYGVRGIPTFFIIDRKGIVRYSYTGMPSDRQVIQQNLEELLAE